MTEKEILKNLGRGKDIRNQKFNKLIPLYPLKERKFQNLVWHCKCDCGNETIVVGADLRNGHTQSCGCVNSINEKKIIDILKENKINFEYQKTFPNCKYENSNYNAIFDFYLPDYNCVIEYDGEQHYKAVRFSNISSTQAEYNLKKTQEHDRYKNEWCKENNIKMIRIPYWDKEKINLNYILNSIK